MTKKPEHETEEEAAARRNKAAAYMRHRRQQLKKEGILAARQRASQTPEEAITRNTKTAAKQRRWQAKLKLMRETEREREQEKTPRSEDQRLAATRPIEHDQRLSLSTHQQQQPDPPSNDPTTIQITTRTALHHTRTVTFTLPLQVLRARSPFIDARCAEIHDWHQVNTAITPGRKKKELVYRIDLPDVAWHVFASYAHLVTTTGGREIELDIAEAPLEGNVEDAWARVVDLWVLCEKLGDVEGMSVVLGAIEEHARIDFPSAAGVKKVFELMGGGEHESVLRRVLVVEVVERREGRELLDIVASVDCADFQRDVIAALVMEREKSRRPARRSKSRA